MNKILMTVAALSLPVLAQAGSVTLVNDDWPPFILEGEAEGKSEQIVCGALQRAGHSCEVKVMAWEKALGSARDGAVDGIAAAWKNTEREAYLLFSEPYLTNRIIPVVRADFDGYISSADDLKGHSVALVSDYAYDESLDPGTQGFKAVMAKTSIEALELVQTGQADVALVDELVARDQLDNQWNQKLTALPVPMMLRSLHFAVSRSNPNAQQLIDDFQQAYSLMLTDGTVNEILEVDWLATDFGQQGSISVVMRNGVTLDDLDNPNDTSSMYALEDSEYQWMRQRDSDDSRVKYQVQGKQYSNLNVALDEAFGKDALCKHNDYSSTFDCTNLFKSRN